jgi:outer membrane protein TolC
VTRIIYSLRNKRYKVKTKIFNRRTTAALILLVLFTSGGISQDTIYLNLEDAFSMSLQNNHLLKIKRMQIEEKKFKLNEERVRYFPSIIVGGSYQYNSNLPGFTIDRGRFGELQLGPTPIPLPAIDEVIEMGSHNTFNTGVTLYQPVTQLGKISAGINISKTDLAIAGSEEDKTAMMVKQGVEKLYFGLLVLEKRVEEAGLRVSGARARLDETANAVAAGKTTGSSWYGLSASVADEEQNLLKLRNEYDDCLADLKQLTGIDINQAIHLEPVAVDTILMSLPEPGTSLEEALHKNNNLKIAALNSTRARYAIIASRLSYLPDLGLIGGYSYQEGMEIYPGNNAFAGASLKWNLQDIFSRRAELSQREYLKQQADENLVNTREQLTRDIEKVYRSVRRSGELLKVAMKALRYRREDLRIQDNRNSSGLILYSDLLAAKAALVKAEADLFAAQLNYRISLSELKILTGAY